MKLLISVTTIIVFIILVVVPFAVMTTIDFIPLNEQPGFDWTEKVYSHNTVTQTISSSHNNLSAIGMSIKNPFFRNKKDLFLKIYKDGNLLRESKLNGLNIGDGDFVRFYFEPILESMGQTFSLELASAQSDERDTLEIVISKSTPQWSKQLKVDEEEKAGSISMVQFSSNSKKLNASLLMFRDLMIRLSKDKLFFMLVLLIPLSHLAQKKKDLF